MVLSTESVARMTVLSLAIALVSVLLTALPASASAVTSFTPACGVVGTNVTLSGTAFTNMQGVTFDAGGAAPTPALVFQFVNDTTATAEVPPGAVTGKIRVEVPAVNDTASAADFTVASAAPASVTSFAPTSGAAGTSVVITGTNFCGTTDVMFNATAATTFTVDSSTQITATVPSGATTGPLHVTTPSGTADSATDFTVTTPTITSFTPTSGAVGATVVITGTNLTGATSVMFNATAATTFTVDSSTQITATVPSGATTGPLHVTTPSGTADSATDFTVTASGGGGGGGGGGGAAIMSFTPTSGPVGSTVVIAGTNLAGATSVTFNGISATFTVDSSTQITATVPNGATTGKITVSTSGGPATSLADFTVTNAPTVTRHDRSVSLTLRKHLIASGAVGVDDGFNACRSKVTVKIQRQKDGVWKTIGTDQTTSGGKYKAVVQDRSGKYRAVAKRQALNVGDICRAAISAPVNHHRSSLEAGVEHYARLAYKLRNAFLA